MHAIVQACSSRRRWQLMHRKTTTSSLLRSSDVHATKPAATAAYTSISPWFSANMRCRPCISSALEAWDRFDVLIRGIEGGEAMVGSESDHGAPGVFLAVITAANKGHGVRRTIEQAVHDGHLNIDHGHARQRVTEISDALRPRCHRCRSLLHDMLQRLLHSLRPLGPSTLWADSIYG